MDYIQDMFDCMYGVGSAEGIANMGWTMWFYLCDLAINHPVTPN